MSNFVKFRLQSMSSKIKRAFEKIQNFLKIRAKKVIGYATKRTINQCKIPHMRKKKLVCKNVLLYNIKNPLCGIRNHY